MMPEQAKTDGPACQIVNYAGVAGKARLTLTIVPAGAPHPTITHGDGTVRSLHPVVLAKIVDMLGGYEGQLTDPLAGQQISVSLAAWGDVDPHATQVVLMWEFYPQHPIAPEHRHLFNQWELTHDVCSTLTEQSIVGVFDGSAPISLSS